MVVYKIHQKCVVSLYEDYLRYFNIAQFSEKIYYHLLCSDIPTKFEDGFGIWVVVILFN